MSETCIAEDCDRQATRRQMCGMHYQRHLRARNLARANVAHNPDLGARVADLRLALEAAHARVTQAVIVLAHPEVGAARGVSVGDLLDDALDHLDAGRQSAPQPKE